MLKSNAQLSSNPTGHIAATAPPWLDTLFAAIDARDSEQFAGFLTEDGVFRFGSATPVQGRDQVREAVNCFFATIAGLRHELNRTWASDDTIFCAGNVTYTRLDGSTITLPFADVFELRDGKIAAYLIYMDIAPLYA